MANSTGEKSESMPDLDDLLQCPVCYEIPSSQIFQCNEGHHVCGRCKSRLELCPVCRSMFFGTRNYAMEELIDNVRKLKAFKLGGKMTVASSEVNNTAAPSSDEKNKNSVSTENGPVTEITTISQNSVPVGDSVEQTPVGTSQEVARRPPLPCKGLFRCLCCKAGMAERLPLARMLNHLRYYHPQDLVEGKSENGQYSQSWVLPENAEKSVTAVRVPEMGIFYLVVEITPDNIHAWVAMAASTYVAHEFRYVLTISGRDREAFFTDCVWSVRACEGTLKKRNRCLIVSGYDAQVMRGSANLNVRVTLRRAPSSTASTPRGMLRVANRGDGTAPRVYEQPPATNGFTLEPLIQGLHDDVERLTRAFNTLGRTVRHNEMDLGAGDQEAEPPALDLHQIIIEDPGVEAFYSRNARRRMQATLRRVLTQAGERPRRVRPAAAPPAAPQDAPPAPRRRRNRR